MPMLCFNSLVCGHFWCNLIKTESGSRPNKSAAIGQREDTPRTKKTKALSEDASCTKSAEQCTSSKSLLPLTNSRWSCSLQQNCWILLWFGWEQTHAWVNNLQGIQAKFKFLLPTPGHGHLPWRCFNFFEDQQQMNEGILMERRNL